ncbi:MAG TPA: STN domain-containing protein [Steroidobacteraceae bacterium]|jgi:type II secretory pathway component GspD/PulD (secretin)|nr:STN domain-containing protein [Steroidobacteraceae bacterium]
MTPTKWARLGILAAVLLLVAAAPAPAQNPARTYSFDMPAEGLGDALRAFGQIAHQQIIFSEDAVRGKRSPRLLGSFTVAQALRLLLAKSGLMIRRTSSGVIYIGSGNACCRHESSSRS